MICRAEWKAHFAYHTDKADILLKKYEQTSDEKEIERIIYELQKIFVESAPSIPLFAEASWAECNTTYFTNFPSAENPYGTLSPNYEHENLFLMLNVRPRWISLFYFCCEDWVFT